MLISNPRLKAPTRVGKKKKKLRKHFPGLSLYESCFFGLFHTRLSKPLVFSPSGRCSSTRFRLEIWVFTNFDRKRKWSRKAPDNERITNKKCSSPPYHEGGALYHELVDKKYFLAPKKAMRCCDICCHFSSSWHSSLAFLTLLVLARLHHPYAQLWLQKR